MWSVRDMFYGEAEPVWIMKPEDNKKGAAESRGNNSGSSGGGSNKKQAEKAEDYSILSSIPYYPYYYPEYNPPPPLAKREEVRGGNAPRGQQNGQQSSQQGGQQSSQEGGQQRSQQGGQQSGQQGGQQGGQPKKDTKVVLKVPICCTECVESIEAALYWMKGVKSVECDTYREKVTVIATTAAPASILMECRRVFKKSRFWTEDD